MSSSASVSSTRPASSLSLKIMFRLAARNFAARNVVARTVASPRLALVARSRIIPCAAFSAAAGLSKDEITTRVLDVLKSFEKVEPSKVRAVHAVTAQGRVLIPMRCLRIRQLSPTASFSDDLGLDSLDAVEVVMAVEEVRLMCLPRRSSLLNAF